MYPAGSTIFRIYPNLIEMIHGQESAFLFDYLFDARFIRDPTRFLERVGDFQVFSFFHDLMSVEIFTLIYFEVKR